MATLVSVTDRVWECPQRCGFRLQLRLTSAYVSHAGLCDFGLVSQDAGATPPVALLCYCRSEEVALVSRQRDTEAASAGSRLASTKPNEVKAPLAKVNGAADAAADSSSSSIVQRIWEDVLKLATGVGSMSSNGSSAVIPGPTAAATAGEAAQMRRKALELIEVVLRAGLVAPWTAVAPLVAQLTDEAVDTRQAALKVCAVGGTWYQSFVVTKTLHVDHFGL